MMMILPFLCLLAYLSSCDMRASLLNEEFSLSNNKPDNLMKRSAFSSCIIAGYKYKSGLYKSILENSLKRCMDRCHSDDSCNYWSYGFGRGQNTCLLYSQIIGTIPSEAKGFSSGLKGCAPTPIPIANCLLTNTLITSPMLPSVPVVNNYVACSQECTANDKCAFWSFSAAKEPGRPGKCSLFSTGENREYNTETISGPRGCPSTNGTSPA